MGNLSLFLDEKLLLSRSAGERTLGPEGQGDHIVVFGLFFLNDLKGHRDIRETASVLSGRLPGGAHSQYTGLVQRDVTQGLALGRKLELLFFFFAAVFSHFKISECPTLKLFGTVLIIAERTAMVR